MLFRSLAVQIAHHLGVARVIATGRNPAALAALRAIGADATITLSDDTDALEDACKREFSQGIDVVLDYLWGPSAQTLMVAAAKAGPDGVPIRFVTIGAASAPSIGSPSAALRSSSLTLMGSGVGSIGLPEDTRRDRRGVASGAARQTANRHHPGRAQRCGRGLGAWQQRFALGVHRLSGGGLVGAAMRPAVPLHPRIP